MVVDRYFGPFKYTVVDRNCGPLKYTVVDRNFRPSKNTVGDRNFGPSKVTKKVNKKCGKGGGQYKYRTQYKKTVSGTLYHVSDW